MISVLGMRQQSLLKTLFYEREGLSTDDLAEKLQITRTAVKQHLTHLIELGFVSREASQGGVGRPRHLYAISDEGKNLFPKQYSWFSRLLVTKLSEDLGEEKLKEILSELAASVTDSLVERVRNKEDDALLKETVKIMNELGYEARLTKGKIEASNCVYHDIAKNCATVCEFDIQLLSRLTRSPVNHEKCIVRGEDVCQFSCTRK